MDKLFWTEEFPFFVFISCVIYPLHITISIISFIFRLICVLKKGNIRPCQLNGAMKRGLATALGPSHSAEIKTERALFPFDLSSPHEISAESPRSPTAGSRAGGMQLNR